MLAGDSRKVKAVLKHLDGVYDVGFDYLQDNVRIRYDPTRVSVAALRKAVREANAG